MQTVSVPGREIGTSSSPILCPRGLKHLEKLLTVLQP